MISLLATALFAASPAALLAVDYHIDSTSGDDAASGVSPAQAWKSVERVNAHTFEAGDRILFKAGTRYSGQLKPQGSGGKVDGQTVPIVIGMFGVGPKPRLDGEGKHLDTVLLRNVEFWEVQDLEVTNLGGERAPWRTGVRIVSDGFGKMRHIRLRRLHVHDVNGDLRKSHEGCGIYFESRGGRDSHFDDLVIEDCHVVRTDRNGICQRTSRGARSLRVIIRGNLLEDIGGDGIKLWGSNGGLVEHNILRGGRTRCEDYAAGIWPFDSEDTVIQFNEVSGMKGTKDGQAFDSDYRCRNSIFQYNYSHDNDGGFMLICTPGSSYNEGTVIRYNISQNDGVNSARVFHFGGGPKNTWVYNNVIYVGPQQDLPLLLFTEWDRGHAQDTRFFNNIFYVAGRVRYDFGGSTNTIFSHNVFWGVPSARPSNARAFTNRPPLLAPGSGTDGMHTLNGYKLRADTREWRGVLVPRNGGRDFFGNPLPAAQPPCVGVFEPR